MPERTTHHEIEHAIFKVLVQADSISEAAPRIVEDVCRALGWDVGALWTLDPAKKLLSCVETWGRPDSKAEPFTQTCRGSRFAKGVGLPGRVWESDDAIWVSDVIVDENSRTESALEAGLHGAFAFPIRVRDRFYGVMEFYSTQVHEPDEELLELFRSIGEQIGGFIEREEKEAELEFQKALLEYQGEASLDGIGVLSPTHEILYWNQRLLQIFGLSEDDLTSGDLAVLVDKAIDQTEDPQAVGEIANTILNDPETSLRIEALRDGRFIDIWTAPVRSPEGRLYGRAIYARDITEQKLAEGNLLRQEEWAAFLADATRVMTESLNVEVILERLAHLAVPVLSDWCAIHLVNAQGDPQQVAVAHIDPAKAQFARDLQEKYPPDPNSTTGASEVIRTRTSIMYPEIPDELLEASAVDEEHLKIIKELNLRSAIIAPIVARDRGIGAITFVSAESGRRYTQEDLVKAEELAGRAAFPIDNARLYAHSREMAQTLQKSFLPPELPSVPGVDLSARYFAAGEGELIGGDFYDAFRVDKGRWGLVLGDVSGKGLEAATVTTLARHTIRGAAMTADRPSDTLRVLNTAMLEQNQTDRFCTAVYATIEPKFGRVRVTVASGGHPAPYVIRNDGTVEHIPCAGTLLGFIDGISLQDATVDLEFGDKLFLYTDGVLDIRQKGGTFGTEGLEKLLYECSKRGTDGSAEHISRTVAELQQGRATDDIAFILMGVQSSVFNRRRTKEVIDG